VSSSQEKKRDPSSLDASVLPVASMGREDRAVNHAPPDPRAAVASGKIRKVELRAQVKARPDALASRPPD
jgi:hypothetical protein